MSHFVLPSLLIVKQIHDLGCGRENNLKQEKI